MLNYEPNTYINIENSKATAIEVFTYIVYFVF